MTIAEAYWAAAKFSNGSRTDRTDSLSSATRPGLSRMVSLDMALGDASTWLAGS